MKYTRTEANEVIDVKGCTTCPHMEKRFIDLQPFMYCRATRFGADGTLKPTKKKLVGKWTGAYHASCPLASKPENVPALPEVKK